MNPKLDQTEMRALQSKLETQSDILRFALVELGGERIERPDTAKDDVVTAVAKLEQHCAFMKTRLAVNGKPAAQETAAPAAASTVVTESANLTDRVRSQKQRAQDTNESNRSQTRAKLNNSAKDEGASHRLTGAIDGKDVDLRMQPIPAKTLTQKVLDAKGCASLQELQQRHAAGEFSDAQD